MPNQAMDKQLFQLALRALQQVNKKEPIPPDDADALRKAAPPGFENLSLDQIAVEIIQSRLRKKP